MAAPDLNLLLTLEALLAEGSVAGAARRLRLSPSAMSRALARLRRATGDPLLVRAGRGLVPTPRALELRERVGPLVGEARAVLRPAERIDLTTLAKTFTLQTSDGFVDNFGPALIARVAAEAPGVRLRFIAKADRDGRALRDRGVDLETGVIGESTAAELRARALFRDRFVGVVRHGHPLSRGGVTLAAYARGRHILVSRRGAELGVVDAALEPLGLRRDIAVIVGGFAPALALASESDLIATVPERHTERLRSGLHTFPLPLAVPGILVSMLWHPRLNADPAHDWLRGCVLDVCAPRRLEAAPLADHNNSPS